MKRFLIALLILGMSSSVDAAWWSKKEKVEPVMVEKDLPEPPKKPEYCNYSIDVGKGNFFVFKGGCEGFKHIGVIDTKKNKVIVLNRDLEKEYDSNFDDSGARNRFIEKTWGDLIGVEFGKVE